MKQLIPDVSISKFNLNCEPEDLKRLIGCYQEVFSGPPWNEFKKCIPCGKKWGKNENIPLNCPECNCQLTEYWPYKTVEDDIRHEVSGDASCWIATHDPDKKVVGFCWGYGINIVDLEPKLKIPGLSETLQSFGCPDEVAYQDELGVVDDFRGRGVAKAMYLARNLDFLNQGLTVGVVRTKRNPPSVTFLWFSRIGYKVVKEYKDADDRVILMGKFNELNL